MCIRSGTSGANTLNIVRGSHRAQCPSLPDGTALHTTCAPFISPNYAGYYSAVGLLILALSGCATQPIPVPEIIHDPTYIPIPATLTAPVKVDLNPGITYGEAVISLYTGLQTCNGNMASIATLKPPIPYK